MKKISNYIGLAVLSSSLLPIAANAACSVSTDPKVGTTLCTGTPDIATILKDVIDWVLKLTGAVAVLFIIWGGLQYITAAGNEKRVESAKQTITYAVIGLIVILLADVIVNLIGNTLNNVL